MKGFCVVAVEGVVTVMAVLIFFLANPAEAVATAAAGSCVALVCSHQNADGLNVESREQTKATVAAETAKASSDHDVAAAVEFTTTVHCGNNRPGNGGNEAYCRSAVDYCGNYWPDSVGPLVQIWDRLVYTNGDPPTGWRGVGLTCYTDLIPSKPALTLAMIKDAFHHTPFAKPGLTLQPKGNLTLVTLPAYYQIRWPTAGYQPGETDTIDPARMLGNTVRIRPALVSYTYHFGDGTGEGPTTSPGGTYPNGDITHAYNDAGRYETSVRVTYTADFSVNGSAWIPIHDTVTLTGPHTTLTVSTATNRLYAN